MKVFNKFVLCVDDDEEDRELVCVAIKQVDPSLKVLEAINGFQAIEFLEKAKETQSFPCLVILDINMPGMDGKETLAAIKKDGELHNLPIVVFSTSNNPMDKTYCAGYGVELVTKPSSLFGVTNEIKRLLSHCGYV